MSLSPPDLQTAANKLAPLVTQLDAFHAEFGKYLNAIDAGYSEDARNFMQDVLKSLRFDLECAEQDAPMRDVFGEHNVWNKAQTGVL